MANYYTDPYEEIRKSYFRKRAYDPNTVSPVQQQIPDISVAQPGTVDPYASEFRKGLRQGAIGLEKDTYGAAKQAASFFGLNPVAEHFEKLQAPLEREMQAYSAPRVQRVEDVQSVADLADYAMGLLGQAAPSMAASVAGGIVGGAVGGPAGAAAGAWGTSAIPQIGDIGERLDAKGESSPLTAFAAGAVGGALDVIPLARGVGRLATREALLPSIGKQMFEEGVTEGAQEVVAQGAVSAHTGESMFSDEALSAYLNNALGGAIAGGAFGGAVGSVNALRNRLPPASQEIDEGTAAKYALKDPDEAAVALDLRMQFLDRYLQGEFQNQPDLASRVLNEVPVLLNSMREGPELEAAQQRWNAFAHGASNTFIPNSGKFAPPSQERTTQDYWNPDEQSAFDQIGEQYAATASALEAKQAAGQVSGTEFLRSRNYLPYTIGEGLVGPDAEVKRLSEGDPNFDYEAVPYLTEVLENARRQGITEQGIDSWITDHAAMLEQRFQELNRKSAPRRTGDDRAYLSDQLRVIKKTPKSVTSINDESAWSLNPRELDTADKIGGYKLVHADREKFKERQKERGFVAQTENGERYVDAINLTNLFMNKLSGRLGQQLKEDGSKEIDPKARTPLLERVSTYFMAGLSALEVNPTLKVKTFNIDDSTIVYREKNNEVRYGEIKYMVDPIRSAEARMLGIMDEVQRIDADIAAIQQDRKINPDDAKKQAEKLGKRKNKLVRFLEEAVANFERASNETPGKKVTLPSGKQVRVEPRRYAYVPDDPEVARGEGVEQVIAGTAPRGIIGSEEKGIPDAKRDAYEVPDDVKRGANVLRNMIAQRMQGKMPNDDVGTWLASVGFINDDIANKKKVSAADAVQLLGQVAEGTQRIGVIPEKFDKFLAKFAPKEGATPAISTVKVVEPMKFSMAAEDNIWGRDTSTIDEIISGNRTSTTRGFWKNGLPKEGKRLTFEDGKGKSVDVVVTKVTPVPRNPDQAFLDQWSKKEGWTIDAARREGFLRGYQVEFRLAGEANAVTLTTPTTNVGSAVAREPELNRDLPVRKIVSGGQTGADFGALLAGERLKAVTGGYAPKGWRTEKGANLELGTRFGLKEHQSDGYPGRTIANINNSDGTVAFRTQVSTGTDKTIGYAHTGKWQYSKPESRDDGHKPILVLTDLNDVEGNAAKIRDFVVRNNIKTLNVAGHREGSVSGIEKVVSDTLYKTFVETLGTPQRVVEAANEGGISAKQREIFEKQKAKYTQELEEARKKLEEAKNDARNKDAVIKNEWANADAKAAQDRVTGLEAVIEKINLKLRHAKYAQGTSALRVGVTAGFITSAINKLAGRMLRNVKVVQSTTDLPGGPHPKTVTAMYDPETKTAYFVADNIEENEVTGLILHEMGVHYGLPRLVGPKLFQQIIDEVVQKAAAGEPAFKRAMELAKQRANDPTHVNEEALAYLVQNAPELGIVRRIIAAIRQWVYRVTDGKLIDLSEADLRAMAVAALRAQGRELKTGKPYYMTTYHGSPVPKFNPEPDNPLGKLRWEYVGASSGDTAFGFGINATSDKTIAEINYQAKDGAVYELHIPDKVAQQLLRFDAKVSEQSPGVQEAIYTLAKSVGARVDAQMTGEQVYKALSSRLTKSPQVLQAALPRIYNSAMGRIREVRDAPSYNVLGDQKELLSAAFYQLGVLGNEYQSGKNTRGYVFFDESVATIKNRYAKVDSVEAQQLRMLLANTLQKAGITIEEADVDSSIVHIARKAAQVPSNISTEEFIKDVGAPYLATLLSTSIENYRLAKLIRDTKYLREWIWKVEAETNLRGGQSYHLALRNAFAEVIEHGLLLKVDPTNARIKEIEEKIGQSFVSVWDKIKAAIAKFLRDVQYVAPELSAILQVGDFVANKLESGELRTVVPVKDFQTKIDFEATFSGDKHATDIVTYLAGDKHFALTGSIAYAAQGSVFRDASHILHDLDFVTDLSREEAKAFFKKKFETAVTVHIINSISNDCDTYLVPPIGHKVADITRGKFSRRIVSYNVRDESGKIVGTYKLSRGRETTTGVEAKYVDLFTGGDPQQQIADIFKQQLNGTPVNLVQFWHGMQAKLNFARRKDFIDYGQFTKYSKRDEPMTADSALNTFAEEQQAVLDRYKATHAKFQTFVSEMAKKLGLTDILLISPSEFVDTYNTYGRAFLREAKAVRTLAPDSTFYGMFVGEHEVKGYGKRNIIWIKPSLYSMPEKAYEVLAHEVGHGIFHEHWKNATPEQSGAVLKEYANWRSRQTAFTKSYQVQASKKGLVRNATFETVAKSVLDANPYLHDMDQKAADYALDFEEWFADQVSRWFETSKEPLTEAEKFFKGIADAFKAMLEYFKVKMNWKTSKAVDELLDDIVRRHKGQILKNRLVDDVRAQRGERAAASYEKFLETGEFDGKVQPPPMYSKKGYLNIKQKFQKGSDEYHEKQVIVDAIKKLRSYNKALGNINADDGLMLLRAVRSMGGKELPKKSQTWASHIVQVFETLLSNADERNVIYRAVQTRALQSQMFKALQADEETMQHIQSSPAVAAAYAYMLYRAGLLKVGPKTFETFGVFSAAIDKLYHHVFGKVSDNDKLVALFDGLEREQIVWRYTGGLWEMPQNKRDTVLQKIAQDVPEKLAQFHRKYTAKLISPAYEHAMSSDNPYIQWVAKKLFAATYDLNPEKSMREAIMQAGAKFRSMLAYEPDGHTPGGVFGKRFKDEEYMSRILNLMQNWDLLSEATLEEKETAQRLRKWFNDVYKYTKDAGLKYDQRKDYFPWYFDPDAIAKNLDEWNAYIRQDKFTKEWEKLLKAKNDIIAANTPEGKTPKELSLDDIWEEVTLRMLGGDINDIDSARAIHNPQFRFMNTRDIWFLGAEELTNSADRRFFASLMQKNMNTVLFTYVRQAVRRAEFARRFGQDGQELWEALRKAEQTGASRDDLDLMVSFIDAMLGTSGIQTKKWLDNQIRKLPISEEWKTKLTTGTVINQKLQNTMGWMMVYQNYRLLALATLSSVIDPLGIGIRSGDMGLAVVGMKEAISATIKAMKGDRADIIQLAEMLGITERNVIMDALVDQYGNNYLGAKQTRINDMLFKYNGLEAWTKLTRLAGTAAALAFIKRHTLDKTKHSDRYMEELGLHKGDVIFDAEGQVKVLSNAERVEVSKEELARDDRVRNGLFRFVEGSILRPDAAQRPLIFSDPHFMLIGHLKSYMFSFYERILKRAYSEGFEHMNFIPMISLLAFIPVMFIGDAIRELIQYGPNGAPWKRGWSVYDHIEYEAMRAGLLGRGEMWVQAEKSGPEAFLGPTVQQMVDFAKPNPSWEKDMVNSLPLQNVYKHWWDAPAAKPQPAMI